MTRTPDEVGWYRDPRHPDRHRFWDGKRWQTQSEHLQPAGAHADVVSHDEPESGPGDPA